MQITELKNTDANLKVKVSFSENELNSEIEEQLQNIAQTFKMPGFRPGKVPIAIVRKKYSTILKNETIQSKISSSVENIAKDRDIRFFMSPEIGNINQNTGLEFEVEYHVIPKMQTQVFSDIVVQSPNLKLDDKEIEKLRHDWLSHVAQEYIEPITLDHSSKLLDKIVLDFTGFMDDVEFEGGKAQDFVLILGSKSMIPGFEEQLLDKRVGDKGKISVTFPENYHKEDLRNKEAVFEFYIKSIHIPRYLKITEELLQTHNLTLEELDKKILDMSSARFSESIRDFQVLQLFDALEERLTFAVSQKLLEQEIRKVKDEMSVQHNSQADKDKEAEQTANNQDEIEKIALRRLRIGMLISYYAQEHDITITREELSRALFNYLSVRVRPDIAMSLMSKYATNQNFMRNFTNATLEAKVIDAILNKEVKLDRADLNSVDLEKLLNDAAASKED